MTAVVSRVRAYTVVATLGSACGDPHALTNIDTADAGVLRVVRPELQECDPMSHPPSRLRVVSWNIKAGQVGGFDAILDKLAALDADIVLLQEVDVEMERTHNVDEARVASRHLGFEYAFAPTQEADGGLYGIATLSRLPFRSVGRISLSNRDAEEPRTALDVRFCIGPEVLRVVNHHADPMSVAANRSVGEISHAIDQDEGPVVFGGDFNLGPQSSGLGAARAAGLVDVLAKKDARSTMKRSRIDYLLLDERTASGVRDARIVDTRASDHRIVLLDMDTLRL